MDRSPTTSSRSRTEEILIEPSDSLAETPVLRLRLQRPKSDRKVSWTAETIDNEEMGKKKSKCCCIFQKTLAFGESSSESEDECEHCYGHVEKQKKKHTHKHQHECSNNPSPLPPDGIQETNCKSEQESSSSQQAEQKL